MQSDTNLIPTVKNVTEFRLWPARNGDAPEIHGVVIAIVQMILWLNAICSIRGIFDCQANVHPGFGARNPSEMITKTK
jgi:hypothetical protein